MSKKEAQLLYNQAKKRRENIQGSRVFKQHILFMDYNIHKQLSSFSFLSICGGSQRNKFIIDNQFETAFNSLSLLQKAQYYNDSITYALNGSQQSIFDAQHTQQEILIPLQFYKGFGSWEELIIKIKEFKVKLWAQTTIDLRNYLIRLSKKTDRKCLVLEAIRHSLPDVIRFRFKNKTEQEKFEPVIRTKMKKAHYQNIVKMTQISKIKQNKNQKSLIKVQNNIIPQKKLLLLKRKTTSILQNQSVLQQILKQTEHQQLGEEELPQIVDKINQKAIEFKKSSSQFLQLQSNQPKPKKIQKNLLKIILPTYQLENLIELAQFISVYSDHSKSIYIYQNLDIPNLFKMQMTVNLKPQLLMKIIYNVQLYKNWHPQVLQGHMKMLLTSDNTAIVYQKHQRCSDWYRQRDFLFVRHLFCLGSAYYLIEKSIQNTLYLPFYTIQRGIINHSVWKIQGSSQGSNLFMEIDIQHQGMLNKTHKTQLTIKYLKGFQHIVSYFQSQQSQEKLKDYLSFDWFIDNEKQKNIKFSQEQHFSVDTQDFQKNQCPADKINDDQIFFSISGIEDDQKHSQNSEHQLNQQQLQQLKQSRLFQSQKIIQLDQKGQVILPNNYLFKRHITKPIEGTFQRVKPMFRNFLLKNDWQIMPQGGLRLINKKKIDAQKNVFKFILSTLKKNLFSGKGITGISLPVDIFNIDSNLKRICYMMSLAPDFIQKASKNPNPIQRMELAISFGFSNFILYFDVEKPFNPILGETYQGWISGCPIYAQQISHHPPISSIYMVGKGYKIYASYQSKVQIHMNSGDGINQGYCHIQFTNLGQNQKITFQTQKGQISGLAFGDRKFNCKGKAYFIDKKNLLFCEIRYQNPSGFFTKGFDFNDQFEGQLLRVTQQFMKRFCQSDKISPRTSDIQETISKISGRWTIQLLINDKKIYGVNQTLPFELKDQPYPLSSNSGYRQDIVYRIKEDIARSQIQKQRLQVIQRNDRKLREKYSKNYH